MKSSDILRYLISYFSNLLYLQWFLIVEMAIPIFFTPSYANHISHWFMDLCGGNIAFVTTTYCSIENEKFQYLLMFLIL
jgi:hypothetical protein